MTFYVKSPARKIVSRISKGDYSDIEQLYKNDVKDHVIQEMLLDKLAEKDCATVLDDFKAEKITYEEASEKLNAYLTLGSKKLETAFGEQEKTLESLNKRRKNCMKTATMKRQWRPMRRSVRMTVITKKHSQKCLSVLTAIKPKF